MNRFIHGTARAIAESFHLPEPILEIGSYQVEDADRGFDLRRLFPGKAYTGLDFRSGPGVDCVADVEALPFPAASFGTVLAFNTFEHVRRFWIGFEEVRRILRPDGVFVVSVPFHFHVHAHPNDYWRFTPEAMDSLLESYPQRVLGWHGPVKRMENVWGVAFREQARLPGAEDLAAYRRRMAEYAREPVSWKRRLGCRLGKLMFGGKPFGSILERDRWTVEVRGRAA